MVPSPAPAETAPEMGHPSKDKASTGGEYAPITTRLRTPLGVSSARTPDSRTASTGRPGRGRGRGRGRRGRPARDDTDVSPQPVKTPPRSLCEYFMENCTTFPQCYPHSLVSKVLTLLVLFHLVSTVKLVIRAIVHRQVSTVDKVTMYEGLILFTQYISIFATFQMFSHIHLYCRIFSLKCIVHTFLFDLCPPCV